MATAKRPSRTAKGSSSELPRDAQGRQYHLGLGPGEVAPFILLTGDVDRAEKIASQFETVDLDRRHREFRTLTGRYRGLPVTALATGIGADNTEIALVELAQVISRPTVIRVGSCGALQPSIGIGHLVVSTAAVRLESASLAYVPEGFPAAAHPEVVSALLWSAASCGVPTHAGLTATASGFFAAQGRSVPGFGSRQEGLPDELARLGVLNMEMEASCLFTLGAVAGSRTGAVCAVYAQRRQEEFGSASRRRRGEEAAIQTALGAVARLVEMDRQREAAGAAWWHPGLAAPEAGERPLP